MKTILISTIATILMAIASFGQPAGGLDNSFNGSGIVTYNFGYNDNITDVKIQPDQKIVAVGTALNASFAGSVMAIRLLPDGSFDDNFGTNGKVVIDVNTESYAYECLILNDGKILLTGISFNPSYNAAMLLIRLNEDGTLDSTFDGDGIVEAHFSSGDDLAYGLIELTDHKIIVAGSVLNNQFQNVPTLVRFNEDGSVDETFGTNGLAQLPVTHPDNVFRNVAISTGGKIVASGRYDLGISFEGAINTEVLVARFNSDGTLDPDFATAGVVRTSISSDNYNGGFGMKVTSDASIVVTGFMIMNGQYDLVLLKYLSTGTLDTNFGTDGIVTFDHSNLDSGYDLEIQADNKIVVAGTSSGIDVNDNDFLVARYNPNGTADLSFGGVGYITTPIGTMLDDSNGMAIQPDGKIVLGGKGRMENDNDIALVRYLGEEAVSVNELADANTFSIYPNPAITGGLIQVKLINENNGVEQIELCDLNGKKIMSVNSFVVANSNQNITIQLTADLTPGIYILHIVGKESTSRFQTFEVK